MTELDKINASKEKLTPVNQESKPIEEATQETLHNDSSTEELLTQNATDTEVEADVSSNKIEDDNITNNATDADLGVETNLDLVADRESGSGIEPDTDLANDMDFSSDVDLESDQNLASDEDVVTDSQLDSAADKNQKDQVHKNEASVGAATTTTYQTEAADESSTDKEDIVDYSAREKAAWEAEREYKIDKGSPYEFHYIASARRRVVAFLIDSIVISGLINLFFSMWTFTPMINFAISTVIYCLYFAGMTLVFKGQTLGKMIMGLRTVRLDGYNLKLSDIFFREIVSRIIQRPYPFLYLIGFFTSEKKQIGDWVANTCVIADFE